MIQGYTYHMPGKVWMRRIADAVLVILFMLSLAWCFWYYTIGATWWQDETYQTLICRHYLHSPVTVLSAWTGNVWMRLFGDNLLSMRILSGLCYLLSTAITTGYFWRVCRNWRWTLLLAIVMIFTFRVHGIRFYGWDAGTIPFTAALSVTAFSCVSSPKIWKIIIGGVLCALVGLGRMPSLALALPMLLLVVAAGWGKSPGKAVAAGALGLSVCVAAGLLLIVAFYGSVGAYVHYFETSGVISGHGTEMWSRILWHELWHDITLFFHNNIAGDLCLGVSLMLIARYSKYALCITLLTVVLILLPGVKYVEFIPKFFIWAVMAACLPVRKYIFRKETHLNITLLVIAAGCCFIPAVGSDRLLLRTEFGMTFPLLMIMLYPYRNGILLWMMVAVIMAASLRLGVMTVRICASDDVAAVEMPGHRGIKDSSWGRDFLGTIYHEAARCRGFGRVGYFGRGRYIPIYFFAPDDTFCINEFHYRDAGHTRELIRRFATHYDAVFVMPEQTDCFYGETLDTEMRAAGFELAPSGWDVPRDEFRLYVRADMISGPEAACCDDFDAVEYTQKE